MAASNGQNLKRKVQDGSTFFSPRPIKRQNVDPLAKLEPAPAKAANSDSSEKPSSEKSVEHCSFKVESPSKSPSPPIGRRAEAEDDWSTIVVAEPPEQTVSSTPDEAAEDADDEDDTPIPPKKPYRICSVGPGTKKPNRKPREPTWKSKVEKYFVL